MPDPTVRSGRLPPGVVSVAEAALRLYDIRPRDVMTLVDEGVLTPVRHGDAFGIDEASIDALLADYETAYGAAQVQAWFDEDARDDDGLAGSLAEAGVYLRDRNDGLAIVAASCRTHRHGAHLFVGVDRNRQVRLVLPMEPATPMAITAGMLAELFLPGERLMIVSDRTGEVPADRPDDELVWEEMVGATRSRRVLLLDWWILWGTKAFSAAEFAPSGPGWARDEQARGGAA